MFNVVGKLAAYHRMQASTQSGSSTVSHSVRIEKNSNPIFLQLIMPAGFVEHWIAQRWPTLDFFGFGSLRAPQRIRVFRLTLSTC
jgi:hypothetical protein